MKNYISLMRTKHYIKNFLIFLPLVFSGNLFNWSLLGLTIIEFISFCLVASSIYVINDIYDYEKDKLHPIKKKRPIASGKVSRSNAKKLVALLLLLVCIIQVLLWKFKIINFSSFIFSSSILLLYLLINIIYSIYAKHIPILDILILSLGFVLRVIYGGSFSNIEISSWLYLTILSFSLYLVLGKRKGELEKNKDLSRKVLKEYTASFLDKFMYIYLALTLVFYSLWCININYGNGLIYSTFIIFFIVMRYSLDIEKNDEYLSDPVEIVTHDKVLIISIIVYLIYVGGILYGKSIGL